MEQATTPNSAEQRLLGLEIKASFTKDLLDKLDRLIREIGDLRQPAVDGGVGVARSLRDDLPPHFAVLPAVWRLPVTSTETWNRALLGGLLKRTSRRIRSFAATPHSRRYSSAKQAFSPFKTDITSYRLNSCSASVDGINKRRHPLQLIRHVERRRMAAALNFHHLRQP